MLRTLIFSTVLSVCVYVWCFDDGEVQQTKRFEIQLVSQRRQMSEWSYTFAIEC